MTVEIEKSKWKEFCDDISRKRMDWDVSIQVLDPEIGAQKLTEDLPFVGVTYEEKNGKPVIEIATDNGAESHQMHIIENPVRILVSDNENRLNDTMDIEDARGVKTLITFHRPASVLAAYVKGEIVAVA
jgi:hypothetical protein